MAFSQTKPFKYKPVLIKKPLTLGYYGNLHQHTQGLLLQMLVGLPKNKALPKYVCTIICRQMRK